jgi:H+-translocating NAD(P) transhydrogenase subunit alpha
VDVGGVQIVGPLNLPSQIPFNASQMYAKNLESYLALLVDKSGALVTSYADEILAASLLTQAGKVVHRPTADLLAGAK